jgi:hypothetical protein
VKLHWDNNYGDYKYFTGMAKEYKEEGRKVYEFAEFLREAAEDIKNEVIHNPETASQEAKLFIDDAGSLWRVNWDEIAKAYYDEVEE